MDSEGVRRTAEWIRSTIGVPFVVVGGSAVERVVPVGTKDVDVLIDGSDWPRVDSAIEAREEATSLEPYGGTIRGTVVAIGGSRIDLEFLSDAPFSGDQLPGTFVRFVRENGSVLHDGVRYATPAVVFYMGRTPRSPWKPTSRASNGTSKPESPSAPSKKPSRWLDDLAWRQGRVSEPVSSAVCSRTPGMRMGQPRPQTGRRSSLLGTALRGRFGPGLPAQSARCHPWVGGRGQRPRAN
jgi:hypothetical protein